MTKVAIIGPGLLGGSLAMAVRNKFAGSHIAVWARRAEAVEKVRNCAIADTVSTHLSEVVTDAGLVILCVPVGAMEKLALEMHPFLSPETLVTDVGSVKEPVVESLKGILGDRFIGSHPMAGSEQAGIEAARPDLFEGAVCIVTPEANTDALEKITGFWEKLGCDVKTLKPGEHDEIMAQISHLPHLVAATLVNLVCAKNPNPLNFCGNGFRDTTRVASGPPEMWTEILLANKKSLGAAIQDLVRKLQEVAYLLDSGDKSGMNEFLAKAKTQRDGLRRTI